MTTRSITLNAAQIRAVILGLGTTDQDHRTRAAGVVVDALTAADEPGETCDCGPGTQCTEGAALRVQLAALRDRAGREAEDERRRQRVERAAAAVVACWPAGSGASIAELHDAVEALREYTPADIAGPES